jgi:RNA polymerase sigma-70 factor (ECF subfamily)
MDRSTGDAVERVFREEQGRALATLIRVLGDFDLAEEALADALLLALERWPRDGVPDNPGAWLVTAARNRAIDRLRRARVLASKDGILRQQARDDAEAVDGMTGLLGREDGPFDDRLRLIFTCCHPALAPEAQVALTLRTLGGLTTPEIARAFLLPEATLAQRLVRAKRKIRDAGIPYRVPPAHELPARLGSVLMVLYLVFNEGYAATSDEAHVRHDLCDEAIRLARLLAGLMPDEPEVLGLLALMLLHDARRDARVDADGRLVLLADQDRTAWDRARIVEAEAILERAVRMGRPGPYQVQAAIVAVHAAAVTAEATDWAQIVALYEALLRMTPTPVVALNHAVAVAMRDGPEVGLARLDLLGADDGLDGYHPYHAARADLLRRLGRHEPAAAAYRAALATVANATERRFLEERLADVSGSEAAAPPSGVPDRP